MPEKADSNALLREGRGIELDGEEIVKVVKGIVSRAKGTELEAKATELGDIDGIFEEGIS